MLVTVTDVEMTPGQSVATATATREDGATLIFGGDWGPMADLAEAVAEEGEVLAYIEPWQILSLDESTVPTTQEA